MTLYIKLTTGLSQGKRDFLRGIGEMPLEVSSIRGEHQRVSVYGDIAVMTGVQHAEWQQGNTSEGTSSVAFTDVFALRGGEWMMVLAYGGGVAESIEFCEGAQI